MNGLKASSARVSTTRKVIQYVQYCISHVRPPTHPAPSGLGPFEPSSIFEFPSGIWPTWVLSNMLPQREGTYIHTRGQVINRVALLGVMLVSIGWNRSIWVSSPDFRDPTRMIAYDELRKSERVRIESVIATVTGLHRMTEGRWQGRRSYP